MYLVTALTVLSVVIHTSEGAIKTSCLGGELEKVLKENAFTGDVSKLLDGKSFSDIWRKKETAAVISCATSKFDLDKDSNQLNAVLEYVLTHWDDENIFKETWTENKGLGTFKVSGRVQMTSYPTELYEQMVYIFYGDENVFGSYACDIGKDENSWRLAISVLRDKQDDPAVKASVEKAEEVLEKLKPVLPSEVAKLTQTRCPVDD